MFWSLRVNDEVQRRNNGFHTLANEGKIGIIAPARAVAFGEDGHSIVLSDGSVVRADAIVLATGYKSSWTKIFDGVSSARIFVYVTANPPQRTR